jgi:hypothetical protein
MPPSSKSFAKVIFYLMIAKYLYNFLFFEEKVKNK